MRFAVPCLAIGILLTGASMSAHADQLDLTFTFNQAYTIPYPLPIPLGSVFHGVATFQGSYVENTYPPQITSFTTDLPGAPTTLSGYNFIFLTQTFYNTPLILDAQFINLSDPKLSFDFGNPVLNLTNWALGGRGEEAGTVTYTYVADAPATTPVPEPSTFALLGTGLLGVAGVIRKRLV